MIKKLNARTVGSLKPSTTRKDDHDTEVRGMSLRVTPGGSKSWTVLYRHRGRLRRLTLGSTDALTLAKAREAREGRAHTAPVRAKTQRPRSRSTAAPRRSPTWRRTTSRNTPNEKNAAGVRTNASSTATSCRRGSTAPSRTSNGATCGRSSTVSLSVRAVMANRVAALRPKMLAFALDQDLIEANPAVRMARPGAEQARARVLSEDEVRALWQSFDDLPPEMAAFYKLRLVTAQRGKKSRRCAGRT